MNWAHLFLSAAHFCGDSFGSELGSAPCLPVSGCVVMLRPLERLKSLSTSSLTAGHRLTECQQRPSVGCNEGENAAAEDNGSSWGQIRQGAAAERLSDAHGGQTEVAGTGAMGVGAGGLGSHGRGNGPSSSPAEELGSCFGPRSLDLDTRRPSNSHRD